MIKYVTKFASFNTFKCVVQVCQVCCCFKYMCVFIAGGWREVVQQLRASAALSEAWSSFSPQD